MKIEFCNKITVGNDAIEIWLSCTIYVSSPGKQGANRLEQFNSVKDYSDSINWIISFKQKTRSESGFLHCENKSGWQDSNLRPPGPKPGAIPGYATSRTKKIFTI